MRIGVDRSEERDMSREKTYFVPEIPDSVARMVRTICADYERRERAIKYSNITGTVLARYIELNAAIDGALQVIEVGIRDDIFRDIASGRGYTRSCAQCLVSKNAYYRRRRKLIYDIARRLALIPE